MKLVLYGYLIASLVAQTALASEELSLQVIGYRHGSESSLAERPPSLRLQFQDISELTLEIEALVKSRRSSASILARGCIKEVVSVSESYPIRRRLDDLFKSGRCTDSKVKWLTSSY